MNDFGKEQTKKLPIRDEYRRNLAKAFSNFLERAISGNVKRIISVGCGFGYEAQPLLKLFPDAYFLGIDTNKDLIDGAKSTNSDLPSADFQVFDGRNLSSFNEAPWDIVILRNPANRDTIIAIENSLKVLRKGGIIFITTDTISEMEKIADLLSFFGNEIEIIQPTIENPFLTLGGGFEDRFIIRATKKI